MSDKALDVRNVQDRLTEKVKNEFAALITDDEWKVLVKSAWDNYFATKKVSHSYGGNKDPRSPFEMEIDKQLHELFSKKVAEELADCMKREYDKDNKIVTQSMFDIALEKQKDHFLQSMIKGMADAIQGTITHTTIERFGENGGF